jgi:mRNA interferase MazF
LVARGDVAWLELEQEGRRPVLVLTRDEAIPRVQNIVVALVTRTIRGIDTEVEIGPADGMPVECAASLDNLRTIPQALLTDPITRLTDARMDEICRALRRAVSCRARRHPSARNHSLRVCGGQSSTVGRLLGQTRSSPKAQPAQMPTRARSEQTRRSAADDGSTGSSSRWAA